ncbi:hypothetical protein N7474_007751 [Penicillium riverlandense]|uniref:uncharacterized protein n=1 Tax=Penicillium riverlandense TaxID=1903569 RepID=UPI0025484EC4|nr:uncharacterized protein N7474_007751 [Penicillium riverlandense]KAJ5811450.1 hypothetical protein N7474_007751 [Penicillium riverlandense]
MADFSEYAGPSADWVALEPTLPALPQNLWALEMKELINKNREELAAKGMESLKSQVQMQDFTVHTRDGATLEARTYRPAGIPATQPLPVYIHLHGGGFLFGTLSSEDAICSRIVVSRASKNNPVVVFNVNYRHTPEHRYPTAWNDTEDAFVWVHEHIAEIGGIADQVVVGGISAGAWMTASLALAQVNGQDERLAACPKIRGQVLMIPCLAHTDYYYAPRQTFLCSPELSSLVQCAEAPILPMTRIRLFGGLLGIYDLKESADDRRMNPGNATAEEVKGLPPTTFGIAGNDPLRDEGFFYGMLLSDNGVPTNVNVFRGVPHGFRRYGDKLSASKHWDDVMSEGITWSLSNPVASAFEIKPDC